MTSVAIVLVVISAVLHVIRDFLTKKSADKQIYVWWISLISTIFVFPVVIYLLVTDGWPDTIGVLIAFGVSFVHFFYWLAYTKAYEGGDLSHVYPIIRSAPALILIFAVIFLNEKVTHTGVTGILLITFGIYLINLKTFDKKGFLEPAKSLLKERYTQFAFLALIGVTAYSLIDKVGVNYVHPLIYAIIIGITTSILFGIYIFSKKPRDKIVSTWKNSRKSILINSLIAGINYPLILFALTMSPVSYVTGLRQIGVIFAVLLGGHVLKESHKWIRLTASFIIFVGAILIAVA